MVKPVGMAKPMLILDLTLHLRSGNQELAEEGLVSLEHGECARSACNTCRSSAMSTCKVHVKSLKNESCHGENFRFRLKNGMVWPFTEIISMSKIVCTKIAAIQSQLKVAWYGQERHWHGH